MDNYLIFFSLCLFVTATPGPAVFLAIRNGVRYGMASALTGICGNVAAMMTMALISALGLGAIVLASANLFFAIKVIGGLYLIYLGIQMWRSPSNYSSELAVESVYPAKRRLFSEAYFVGISNPKAIAFYTALFPQFIDASQPLAAQFSILAITFAVCSFSFLALYALLARRVRRLLDQGRVARWFNRIVGGVFAAFGLALMSSEPKAL